MQRFLSLFAGAILAVLIIGPRGEVEAASGPKPFTTVLTGGQMPTPTGSNELGVAFLWFDKAAEELCYSVTHTIPAAEATSAAIHVGGIGVTGAIAHTLSSTGDSPFENCVGFANPVFQKRLRGGTLHIRVNSSTFPQGEIRGQIVPSAK